MNLKTQQDINSNNNLNNFLIKDNVKNAKNIQKESIVFNSSENVNQLMMTNFFQNKNNQSVNFDSNITKDLTQISSGTNY